MSPATDTTTGSHAIRDLLPAVRQRIDEMARPSFPALARAVAGHLTDHPLPAPMVLPMAACAASGGDPVRAVPVGAAGGFLALAMRWFDDVQDQDREGSLWQEVGVPRATNVAAGALTLAWRTLAEDETVPRSVLRCFGWATMALASGQDGDLEGRELSVDEHWELMRRKTAAAFAMAARAGALAGDAALPVAETCNRFGEHVGMAIQILDDLDGLFRPCGLGDLAMGKVTFPVLYGLRRHHPAREELRSIVREGRLATEQTRVREILEDLHTRRFLGWAALEEYREARACIDALPAPTTPWEKEGRRALTAFANCLFGDLEILLR